MSEYLVHYGVKGQKWGRRNWQLEDGTYTAAGRQHYGIGNKRLNHVQNPNYSTKQRTRDKSLYGRGGVRRINRALNNGNSISGARSVEATRINKARARATRAGKVGSFVGSFVGYKLGGEAIRTGISLGGTIVGSMLGGKSAGMQVGASLHNSLETNLGARIITGYIGSVVGNSIGRNVGRSIGMHSEGYSSKLYRYAN